MVADPTDDIDFASSPDDFVQAVGVQGSGGVIFFGLDSNREASAGRDKALWLIWPGRRFGPAVRSRNSACVSGDRSSEIVNKTDAFPRIVDSNGQRVWMGRDFWVSQQFDLIYGQERPFTLYEGPHTDKCGERENKCEPREPSSKSFDWGQVGEKYLGFDPTDKPQAPIASIAGRLCYYGSLTWCLFIFIMLTYCHRRTAVAPAFITLAGLIGVPVLLYLSFLIDTR